MNKLINNNIDKNNLYLILIVLIGSFLRLYHIGAQSIWVDEAIQLEISQGTINNLFKTILTRDNTPPLFHLIINSWSKISIEEWWLRIPSAIFGILTLVAVYKLGSVIINKKTGLLSSFILAISPFHIWYSQEMRSYALLIFLTTLSLYFFWQALYKDEKKYWIGYIIITLLGLYTHAYFGTVVVVHNIYYFFHLKKVNIPFRKWLLVMIIMFLGYIPGLIFMFIMVKNTMVMLGESGVGKRSFSIISFVYIFYTFLFGYFLGPTVEKIHTTQGMDLLIQYLPLLVLLAVLFVLIAIILLKNIKDDFRKLDFLLLNIIIPIILVSLVSVITNLKFNVRYVCFAFPAFIVLTSYIILRSESRIIRNTVLILTISLMLFSAKNYYFDEAYGKDDSREAAAYLEENFSEGDCIYVLVIKPALEYYLPTGYPVYGIFHSLHHSKVVNTAKNYNRLWFVVSHPWEVVNYSDKTQEFIMKDFNRVHNKRFTGIDVVLFSKKKETN